MLKIRHNAGKSFYVLLIGFSLKVAINPNNTIFDAKRLIGRKFDESTVQSDMKHWPFTVVDAGGRPKLQVEYKNETKTFTPEEISSMVLNKMKETAEAYLGQVRDILVFRFNQLSVPIQKQML